MVLIKMHEFETILIISTIKNIKDYVTCLMSYPSEKNICDYYDDKIQLLFWIQEIFLDCLKI